MRTTKLMNNLFVLVSLVLLSTCVNGQSVTADTSGANGKQQEGKVQKDLSLVFEVGGQYAKSTGDRPSKFEEYKSVRDGFLARRVGISYKPADSPRFFDFAMRNGGDRDRQFFTELGRYGRYRTKFQFNEQPHLFSRGASLIFDRQSPGVYTVPDGLQATLQALDVGATGSTITPNPALVSGVRSFLSANPPTTTIRSQRQTLGFEQRFDITSNWSLRFRFMDTRRTGVRPLGTGSYERISTSLGDTFRAHEVEIPAELDQRTDTFTVGTSYLKPNWGVNFDLHFSRFANEIGSYGYDNPFRLTDQATTGSNGALNRMAFARGLHSTMPDNQSRGFMISAFVDLPRDSRWAGAFGWDRWTQDEQFLPYTLNTTVTATGLTPTSTSSLPKQSLEGVIDNLTVDQLLTTRPWKNLAFNLHYRAYQEENKTEPILFPGYAAYLEAYWRPAIVGTYGTRLIENEPASFLRQRASGEIIWDISSKVRWRGEYEFEAWNRHNRQVGRSNENKFGTFLSFKPTNSFKANIDLRYQKRKPQFYDPGFLEFSELRMFDQAERTRNNVSLKWQWAASPRVGLAGDFTYLSDDYDKTLYGTTAYKEYRGGADLLYNASENTTFYLNYSREHYRTSLQSVAKGGGTLAQIYNPANNWNRNDRNVNDNFGAGLTTYLDRGKWFLDMNYAINNGKDLISTFNPNTPVVTATTNATAYPFPEAKYRYQEFSVDTNYQVRPNVALGIRYYFEPYKLDDWQWNTLSPYPVDQLAPETDGRRFLVLDSRYTDHRAHVISVYIRFGN